VQHSRKSNCVDKATVLKLKARPKWRSNHMRCASTHEKCANNHVSCCVVVAKVPKFKQQKCFCSKQERCWLSSKYCHLSRKCCCLSRKDPYLVKTCHYSSILAATQSKSAVVCQNLLLLGIQSKPFEMQSKPLKFN